MCLFYSRGARAAEAAGANLSSPHCVRIARRRRRMRSRRLSSGDRRGSVLVEFAFVAIPLFLFIFASIEFGRAMMARQSMEEAARAGCREAVIRGATTQEVEDQVDEIMQMAGVANYTVTIDPVAFSSLDRWQPISVSVTASFADMTWLPVPMYLGSATFTSSCTLPKEAALEL